MLSAVGGLQLFEEKLRGFFRSSIDEVIDTARTGRFFFSELEKTEKTYLGTKFEIILRDWLQVPKGVFLDLMVGGQEVDVKSTTSGFGWMIPPEAFEQLCILLKVDEAKAKCAVGLVRARSNYLRAGENRDLKTSFSASGRSNIWWVAVDFDYTRNFWQIVSPEDRLEIMGPGGGSQRVALLFEKYQNIAISRVQIIAVAAQDDPMRRVRRNGGARDILAPKGIAILYSETDRDIMRSLGLTFGTREFISYAPQNDAEAILLRNAGHID
ncbi:NaeI family type II restriction endonuclease [Sphingomonas soli]|uniref:NaeI family type II restriction endonuclease n=1 Tax=Sphingomonas soli TaxID=266127 RepID=UPI000B114150|nr:NaeI family type II restriction endonuclease [Sphingomonas soli]